MQSLENDVKKAEELLLEKYTKLNKEDRLNHIYGVKKMAEMLAIRYDVDINKARIAALMHDYSKYDKLEDNKDLLNEEEIEECIKYPFMLHAYLSSKNYKKYIGDDIDIYNAIRYHIFGRPKMSMLEKIIMISDYTEENRTYPTCIECRKILLNGNLDLAIYKSLLFTKEHIIKDGGILHPLQIEVYNEYKDIISKINKEDLILDALNKIKAFDIISYDTSMKNPFYDKMIVASVNTLKSATAAISYIEEAFNLYDFKIKKVEGRDTNWVLIDCYDVIVSIFEKEERKLFDIDKLYLEYPKRNN